MAKPWQQSLLSSGLPLENDLRAYLISKGCISHFEYSYLKPDELTVEKEFSYDIDASYIKGHYFIDLMVECKYRHPGARWVFTPDQYGGHKELEANDFMHPFDHFVKPKFPFSSMFPRQLAPVCSKGVEILNDGTNEKTITQAINQLAYAFAPKLESAIEHQIYKWLVEDIIFFNVPIVATTAELFRLKDDIRINTIRDATTIEEIATREPCLIMNYNAGAELCRYNNTIFDSMRARLTDKKLKKHLNSHTNSLKHFFSVITTYFCPKAIVFVTIDEKQVGFEKLFNYIDNLIKPDESLKTEIRAQEKKLEEMLTKLDIDLNEAKSLNRRKAR